MKNKNFLTLELNLWSVALMICGLCMVLTGLYLTQHYYEVNFPTSLENSSSLCHLSTFFNCDSATVSSLAQFFGIPTGVFGALMGIFLLLAFYVRSKEYEGYLKTLLTVNALGCLLFFLYSVVLLKTLCPFCTLYYALSWICLIILIKKSEAQLLLDKKSLILSIFVALPMLLFFAYNTSSKLSEQNLYTDKVIEEYHSLPKEDKIILQSPFFVNPERQDYVQAPLRLSIFSDFQCPSCKKLSELLHTLLKEFSSTLSVQYFFFPLDSHCNSQLKQPMHPYACKAALLASCSSKSFAAIHDDLFFHQKEINDDFMATLEKKYDLSNCQANQENLELIKRNVALAVSLKIDSTPTFYLNEKKIAGSIPLPFFRALLRDLLKEKK
jgi:uncharacterized membrane protein/predicted DsbA family dithiol-disulfide isomerase